MCNETFVRLREKIKLIKFKHVLNENRILRKNAGNVLEFGKISCCIIESLIKEILASLENICVDLLTSRQD